MHDARNLICVTCHSVHSPKAEHAQLKAASVTDTCVACHKTEVAKLQRFGHMPLREGKMECSVLPQPARIDERADAEGRQLRSTRRA